MSRKYVKWNSLTYQERLDVLNNIKDYFILIDIRLSEYASDDIKGLPDFMKDVSNIIWKSPFWTKPLEHPDSAGILFFDEVNLSEQSTLKSCFKIFYDRQINEGIINDKWTIISAGNLESDRSFVQELPYPLKDRVGEAELLPPIYDKWINWALKNNIDFRIIGFINFSPSKLRVVDYNDNQKPTTERGWKMLSDLIKEEFDYDRLSLLVPTRIGEGVAREFLAFCKLNDTIQLDKIIANPSELKNIEAIDMKYFIISAIAEHYSKDISQGLEESKSPEFITLMWRIASKYNPTKFRKDYQTKELTNPLKNKYNKYLLPSN
jgi:hypothetical protein